MLPEIVARAAAEFGQAPAVVAADGWALSYADLHRLSDDVAAGLARTGVERGDVVGLCLPSTPEYLVAYAAIAKLGAVTAGVNPRLAERERHAALAAAHPAVVLATAELAPGAGLASQVIEVERAPKAGDVLAGLRRPGDAPPALPPDPARPVAIVFTSGTTGVPKGAVFTNRQLEAIAAMDSTGAWGGGGPNLAATQFAHVGTMTKLPWQLRAGGTLHLLERWRPADALRKLHELRAPAIAGVPPQLALLLRVPDLDRYDWGHVQAIVVGGGPVTPALVEEATRRFSAPMSVRYSSTESGGVGCGTAFDAPPEEALTTVGRPRGVVELSIRDEHGRPRPDGEVGEVCFRSPAATIGYWRNPEATAELFWPDGFLRMGDLGYVVADGEAKGCLRLAGRAKEMYVRGGYNVYPMEVEAVLSAHPAVTEVAVVPRTDPVMGEIGVAVVVPADPDRPPGIDELRSFASRELAAYKLPEAIELADELPLTAMEKLDRRALRSRYGGTP